MSEEYLRRNLIHAASVGMKENAQASLRRLRTQKSPPGWLIKSLEGIVERGERVCPELAARRDELMNLYPPSALAPPKGE